jgi:hypothetical protein
MLANEIEQQVERALERFKKYFQRIRRNIQVPRHLRQQFTMNFSDRTGKGRMKEIVHSEMRFPVLLFPSGICRYLAAGEANTIFIILWVAATARNGKKRSAFSPATH